MNGAQHRPAAADLLERRAVQQRLLDLEVVAGPGHLPARVDDLDQPLAELDAGELVVARSVEVGRVQPRWQRCGHVDELLVQAGAQTGPELLVDDQAQDGEHRERARRWTAQRGGR